MAIGPIKDVPVTENEDLMNSNRYLECLPQFDS